jgi:Flp pilus assembly protein TadG
MAMLKLLAAKARAGITRFRHDRRGSIAILTAITLPVLSAGVGFAVDYSMASSARTQLQAGVDSGVLASARDANTKTDAQIAQRVKDHIDANAGKYPLATLTVQSLTPSAANRVRATARGCVATYFASLVGTTQICVSVDSEAERPGSTYLEVALVIDNSGSMSGSKINAAKQAAKDFAKTLFDISLKPEQVKISVVPFTLSVNAGPQYRDSGFVDKTAQSSIHWENVTPPAGVTNRFDLYDRVGETWNGCFETRPGTFATSDDNPTAAAPDSLYVPMFAPDEPGERGQGTYRTATGNHLGGGSSHSVSNSWLNDDGSQSLTYVSNAVTAATPTGASAACPISIYSELDFLKRQKENGCRYNIAGASNRKSITGYQGSRRGPNYYCDARPLLRMQDTTGRSNVEANINAMAADGNTNIFEGFMWGWRTVSPNGPFKDGRAYTWKQDQIINRKIVVVLTDGDNFWAGQNNPNNSIYSMMGYYRNNRLATNVTNESQANAAMNAKLIDGCTNAKATRTFDNKEGVTIYTVGFSTPGQEISATGLSVLQNCASMQNGSKLFFKAENSTQLISIFQNIAKEVGQVRLTQ